MITDSVVVANYLDEKYPEPPLYNNETKNRDLELLDHFSKVFITMLKCNLSLSGNDPLIIVFILFTDYEHFCKLYI